MRRIRRRPAATLLCACGLLPAMLSSVGCKSLNEAYLRLEVWKYERCFGHLPPGFVPTGVAGPAAGPAMQPCGQPSMGAAPCGPAPCGSAVGGPPMAGGPVVSGGCEGCSGSVVEGVPAGAIPAAGTTVPTPSPAAAVTTSKPVIISDEVVLP